MKKNQIDQDDKIYTCNGCAAKLAFEEIACENADGDNYCSDCNEAIQSDNESSGRLPIEDNIKTDQKEAAV